MSSKRIGILTGGGDVPGLNQAIKGVVYHAAELGHEVIGLRRGWEGLTHLNFDDEESKARYIKPLSRDNTRTVDRTGGTFLHSSRTNPQKMKKVPDFLNAEDYPTRELTKRGVTSTVFDITECHYQLVLDTKVEPRKRSFRSPFIETLEICRRIGQMDMTAEEVHDRWYRPRLLGYAKDMGVEFQVSDLGNDGTITVEVH